MSSDTTLVSIAMLKVNFDEEHRDYIDYFIPFVIHALQPNRESPVTADAVRDELDGEFGIRVPVQALHTILGRLAKREFLRKEHNAYFVSPTLPKSDLTKRRDDVEARQRSVFDAIVAFARTRYEMELALDSVSAAVLRYLSKYSIEYFRSVASPGSFSTPTISKAQASDEAIFIVNAFLAEAHTSNRPIFEDFMVLVKGRMLANALFCPDLSAVARKFQDVTFYLDTPLVLRLLGLEGADRRTAVTEMVGLLRDLGAVIAIFEHTDEEVSNVIVGCVQKFDSPDAWNRIPRQMRSEGKTASDLALILSKRRRIYDQFAIQFRARPGYMAQFQIDEPELETAIQEEIVYGNPRALQYDIESIRCIFALRRGKRPHLLESAIAVMVTSNVSLAKSATRFTRASESISEAPPMITDYSLVNLAWLKAPLSRPDVPEVEVLATCYAALSPSERLWRRYVEEVDRLQGTGELSPDEHFLLRHSLKASDELMTLTLGSDAALERRTIKEILERVRSDLTRDKEQEIVQLQELAEKQLVDLANALREAEAQAREYNARLEALALSRAKLVAGAATVALFGALVIGGVYAFIADAWVITDLPSWAQKLAPIALAIFGIYGLVAVWYGTAIADLRKRLQDYLFDRFRQQLAAPKPTTLLPPSGTSKEAPALPQVDERTKPDNGLS